MTNKVGGVYSGLKQLDNADTSLTGIAPITATLASYGSFSFICKNSLVRNVL